MITAVGILLAGVGVGMVYAGATNQPLLAPIAGAFGLDLGTSSGTGSGAGSGDGKNFPADPLPRPGGKAPGRPFAR